MVKNHKSPQGHKLFNNPCAVSQDPEVGRVDLKCSFTGANIFRPNITFANLITTVLQESKDSDFFSTNGNEGSLMSVNIRVCVKIQSDPSDL